MAMLFHTKHLLLFHELSAALVMVRVSLTNPGMHRKKSIKMSENLNIKKMSKFDHRDVEMEWQ